MTSWLCQPLLSWTFVPIIWSSMLAMIQYSSFLRCELTDSSTEHTVQKPYTLKLCDRDMYKINKSTECFMPCLVRPELLALEYYGCLKRIQGERVLVHGRKAQWQLLDIGKLPLVSYRKFPFSSMKFGRIFCYILFPRLFLSGTLAGSSSPGHSLWP